MSFFQFISLIIFISQNFYKCHSWYNDPKFINIKKTNNYPIKYIYETYDEPYNSKTINIGLANNNIFSLVKKNQFSTQCLKHYFINENDLCPITTDIKSENENRNECYNNKQVNNYKTSSSFK